ncbi:MAG: undecaprenyl/decaprenyl-phosphate alpha-N-acetylglucosaminyl 1-phosphate transferase [Actinomycetota bacterium]|nr:undecaprenyl/decaprenyl-phosphate alpha-N-acetylglucosaminyl 1-phosphate transferase [Actinomycetota bacterium]
MSFLDSLHALVHDGTAVWGFVTAAAIVLALTPLVARLAPLIGGVDDKADRPRIHGDKPIARIGGLAIVAGISIPMAAFLQPEGKYLGILLGTLLVATLGLVDDIRGMKPSVKMLGIVTAALIPVVGFDLVLKNVSLPLLGFHDLGWAAYPLTIFWIVALANLVNLIDGMDALASGIVAIAAGSFALLAASFARADAAALAAIICGATLAFLWHNYHPAKIFMGDSGSLALGFLLATVAVQGVLKTAATIALVGPLLVMAVPILDTSFVIAKRMKYRRPVWNADYNHFYHRFMRIGFTQRRTAAYLHLWAMLLAGYAILLRFLPPRPHGIWDGENVAIAVGVGVVVIAASVWMVYTLEILKSRHLHVLRRGRDSHEPEEAVERAVSAGPR